MLEDKVRERIHRALAFEEPDRVPICEYLNNPAIFHYFSHSRNFTLKEKIKAYHGLEIDLCWNFIPSYLQKKEGLLSRLKGWVFEDAEAKVLTREQVKKETDDYRRQKELFAPKTCLAMSAQGCLDIARKKLGGEDFSRKMYADPLEIERVMEIFAENLYQRAREFADQRAGEIFFIKDDLSGDSAAKVSLKFLRELWLPKIRNAIIPLKEAGVKVILHARGNITELLGDLVAEGIDGVHPVASDYGMNIGLIKKTFGKTLLLFGNIDIYGKKEPEDIFAQTKKCIEMASYGGGHFIGSCYGITNQLPLKNIFSMFSAIKENGTFLKKP